MTEEKRQTSKNGAKKSLNNVFFFCRHVESLATAHSGYISIAIFICIRRQVFTVFTISQDERKLLLLFTALDIHLWIEILAEISYFFSLRGDTAGESGKKNQDSNLKQVFLYK